MDGIKPPNATAPVEQLNGSEREAVEGWLKDVHLLLFNCDLIRDAKNEEKPIEQRERSLSHAEGSLTALKFLTEEFKKTGKTLLQRLTPPTV